MIHVTILNLSFRVGSMIMYTCIHRPRAHPRGFFLLLRNVIRCSRASEITSVNVKPTNSIPVTRKHSWTRAARYPTDGSPSTKRKRTLIAAIRRGTGSNLRCVPVSRYLRISLTEAFPREKVGCSSVPSGTA